MFLSGALDLLLPRHCAVCGDRLLANENVICDSCARNMPLTYFWTQEHNLMADRLNARIQALYDASPAGNRVLEPYSNATALYFYKLGYRKLSQALKYDANMRVGRYLAEALGRKVMLSPCLADVDVVVPVPLHFLRRLHRGYNQSEVIALPVARQLGVPVNTQVLRRCRFTRSQARLDVASKGVNVSGAFAADVDKFQDGCFPRHILLIDDVFTTGATMAECHRALRAALVGHLGAEDAARVKISAATLAFVGD